jgi:hypothetical protein
LLCNRAGSVARLNQSDIVFIFSIRLLAHLGEARPAISTIEHCEECQHDRTPLFDHRGHFSDYSFPAVFAARLK